MSLGAADDHVIWFCSGLALGGSFILDKGEDWKLRLGYA